MKIVGLASPASYSPPMAGNKVMILLSQFGGKTYNMVYYGTPEAYNTYLPTAQQIIESFNAGRDRQFHVVRAGTAELSRHIPLWLLLYEQP